MLGGEVWPASWAVCHHLQRILPPLGEAASAPMTIVELGAGAGLCALVAALVTPSVDRVVLTDSDVDLCVINAATFAAARPEAPPVEVSTEGQGEISLTQKKSICL